jgi:hypothetical protein
MELAKNETIKQKINLVFLVVETNQAIPLEVSLEASIAEVKQILQKEHCMQLHFYH